MDKYIAGWSSLNWKGKAAKLQQYYDQGKSELSPLERVWAVGAVLWLKDFTLWQIAGIVVVLVPVALLLYALFGYWWTKRGWYRQKQEVSVMDAWSPMANLQWTLLVRMAHAMQVSVQDIDLRQVPPEVREKCLSLKEPHA